LIISALLGIFTGVYVYNAFFPVFSGLGGEQRFITLPMLLDMRFGYAAIAFGLIFLAISFLLDRIDPAKKFDRGQENMPLLKREWGWFPTGIIAGLMIFLTTKDGEYLSFSGGFLALGAYIASLFGQTMQSVPSLTESTEWRAMLVLGIFPGAFLSSYLAKSIQQEKVSPLFQAAFGQRLYLRIATVFIAGFLMIIGALTGGGCTTGAFMSGWPTLSVGSFVMGMTFFGSAIFTAHILYFRKYNLVHEVKKNLNLAND
jgi:hypothetical protein